MATPPSPPVPPSDTSPTVPSPPGPIAVSRGGWSSPAARARLEALPRPALLAAALDAERRAAVAEAAAVVAQGASAAKATAPASIATPAALLETAATTGGGDGGGGGNVSSRRRGRGAAPDDRAAGAAGAPPPTRLVALRVAYDGGAYRGLAAQTGVAATVEAHLFRALGRTRLVAGLTEADVGVDGGGALPALRAAAYARAGRTDKGVSATCQVLSLRLRCAAPVGVGGRKVGAGGGVAAFPLLPPTSSRADAVADAAGAAVPAAPPTTMGVGEDPPVALADAAAELDYVRMLNSCLPPDIRVLAWAAVVDPPAPAVASTTGAVADADADADMGIGADADVAGAALPVDRPRRHDGMTVGGPGGGGLSPPEMPASTRARLPGRTGAPFSARFDALHRAYKYFFLAGGLDVAAMATAARSFEGVHDYRHFCKADTTKPLNTVRRVYEAAVRPAFSLGGDRGGVGLPLRPRLLPPPPPTCGATPDPPLPGSSPSSSVIGGCVGGGAVPPAPSPLSPVDPYTVMEFYVRGQAFLWHQVRHMVAVLLAVGARTEAPSIVTELLSCAPPFDGGKPLYRPAPAEPLVLVDVAYPGGCLAWAPAAAGRGVGGEGSRLRWLDEAATGAVAATTARAAVARQLLGAVEGLPVAPPPGTEGGVRIRPWVDVRPGPQLLLEAARGAGGGSGAPAQATQTKYATGASIEDLMRAADVKRRRRRSGGAAAAAAAPTAGTADAEVSAGGGGGGGGEGRGAGDGGGEGRGGRSDTPPAADGGAVAAAAAAAVDPAAERAATRTSTEAAAVAAAAASTAAVAPVAATPTAAAPSSSAAGRAAAGGSPRGAAAPAPATATATALAHGRSR
ncbi:hypothetical protein MMPV_000829 [Pyropia vietnamensis]